MSTADPITHLNAALEGRYRIERELGEGGMATVYLADDLRHERKVALKVLKPELAAVVGAERFLAEIKTTANLQHPHILPLFDSGEADSFLFYVMPHVEGESLRTKLDRERQLPVDEAVRIATDMAEALDYAHRHGVIHRDIKPGNVLIHDGQPVISDFGIALAVGTAGAGRLTETGLSVGTPHYMSPEQATGDQTVGAATDIYALGCVLYEMLVGEPPYTGSTAQAILGKIIQAKGVSAAEARTSVPRNVDAAIRKALEKLSADRFASAKDFADALAEPAFRHGESAGFTATERTPWRGVAAVLAVLFAAAAGVAAWALARAELPRPVNRFVMTTPSGVGGEGAFRGLAVSPDGRTLVFADAGGRLFRRDLAQADAVLIPETQGVWYPFFSPDGVWVGYFELPGNALRKVRLDGGLGQTLAPVGGTNRSAGWGPDGTIVFEGTQTGGLMRVRDTGGDPELLVEGQGGNWMDLLPHGRALVTSAANDANVQEVFAVTLETGERTSLLLGTTPRYVSTGHLLFWRDGGLWAVPFDADALELTGDPTPLVENVTIGTNNLADFAVGGDVLFYREGVSQLRTPAWIDREGRREVLDPALAGVFGAPAISPDGTRIAFEYDTPGAGSQDIWVYSVEQQTFSRLTFAGALNRYPFWSPDGREIGFSSDRDGLPALYARPADLSADARLLLADPDDALYEAQWTPDGQWLVYRWGSSVTNAVEDLRYTPVSAGGDAVPIAESGAIERNPALSPDGRWLAYASEESGRPEVYVRPFPGPGGRAQVSTDGGTNPVWTRDGRELLFISDTAPFPLISASVRTEPDFAVLSREALIEGSTRAVMNYSAPHPEWDVSDGEHILAIVPAGEAEGRYVVVDGLSEELRRIAPSP